MELNKDRTAPAPGAEPAPGQTAPRKFTIRKLLVIVLAVLVAAGVIAGLIHRSNQPKLAAEKYCLLHNEADGDALLRSVPKDFRKDIEEFYGCKDKDVRQRYTEQFEYLASLYDGTYSDVSSTMSFKVKKTEKMNDADLKAFKDMMYNTYQSKFDHRFDIRHIESAKHIKLNVRFKVLDNTHDEARDIVVFEYKHKWYAAEALDTLDTLCASLDSHKG